MAKGIIYIMTTAVDGLIKIGKTGSKNFKQRMYDLEHNGYRNVTALKRVFAIEVEDYDEKEAMLHTIFEKSQLSDTELFALDVNIAIQLLSSFEGSVIFPETENKEDIFEDATNSSKARLIPNGKYIFKKKKKSDNKVITASAVVQNGHWTLLQGSILGLTEDAGVSNKAKAARATMPIGSGGVLLADVDLGVCTPSFVGQIVMNQSNNGWEDWRNAQGTPIDAYRKKGERYGKT